MLDRQAMILGILGLLFCFTGTASAVVSYDITDLGTLGGSDICPHDINNQGQVVGYGVTHDTTRHAFLYDQGIMTDLGVLPGENRSYALGIDDGGQIAGYSGTPGGTYHAFLYDNGTMTDIGTLPGYDSSMATAINNNGTTVGCLYNSTSTSLSQTFLYENGVLTNLGMPEGDYSASFPSSINVGGQIAGHVLTSAGNEHPALYKDGQWIDLGTLGGDDARATSINDNGQVTGWSWMEGYGGSHAFLYENGIMTDLGLPTGWGSVFGIDINSDGQIVGRCTFGTDDHACMYSNGSWSDLNDLIDPTLDWTLEKGIAINDSGWIVGVGKQNGIWRAFLLTPVPEPSTLSLLCLGTLSLLIYRCRKNR